VGALLAAGPSRLRTAVTAGPRRLCARLAAGARRLRIAVTTAPHRLRTAVTTAPRRLRTAVTTAPRRLRIAVTTAPHRLRTAVTTAPHRLRTAVTTAPRRLRIAVTTAPRRLRTAVTDIPRGRDLRYGAAVTVVVAIALVLRLWGDRSGLPWAYNTDEAQEFVPYAIGMLGGNLNPGYFINPPAFTYLLAGLLQLWFGSGAREIYRSANSTDIWLLARVTSAVLGTLAVWLLYLVGARLFNRRTGLLASAVMAVAFLPVFYGKLALNDAVVLAPVCLSLWGSAGIAARGRRRDYAIAGIGLGLAAATKYTGGIVVLPLVVLALSRVREPARRWFAVRWLILAGLIALAAFIVANPYSVLDFHAFINQLAHQSSESQQNGKLGLTHGSGISYYLWSIAWGVGWVPALAAVAGALALLVRREWWTFVAFVPAVIGFLVFMGLQGRYFGRWVMPIVPVVCLFGANAAVAGAELAARGRPRLCAALVALAAAALCGQGLVYSVHSGLVNSRADTRSLARAWLVAHVRPGTRIVVEPIVSNGGEPPDNWTSRWIAFTDLVTHRGPNGVLYVLAGRKVKLEDYERTLSPALVSLYERDDYCVVVTGSTEQGRALTDPAAVPKAIAYYDDLARQGTRAFVASPYAKGSPAVAFNFDWSFDYYPLAYTRPGPLVTIWRLHGGACGSRKRAAGGHRAKHRSSR
jgi:4-amino-4-deoxy-L-arabinose transferase-like glycosyltransferase